MAQRYNTWALGPPSAAGLFGIVALAAGPVPAGAADIQQSTAIECQVSGGRGAIAFGPSKHLGAAAGTKRFSPWVWAAMAVMMAGMFLVQPRAAPKPLAEPSETGQS